MRRHFLRAALGLILSVTASAAPLVITTGLLPDGTVGTAYSQTLGATGGAGGDTWTITAGALPAGLTLSPSGTISGTPTSAAISIFTVTVTDSNQVTAFEALSITV